MAVAIASVSDPRKSDAFPRASTKDDEQALCWGSPRSTYAAELGEIRRLTEEIESALPLRDGRRTFESKVSFADAIQHPLHRWYFYKEGFSPDLLRLVVAEVDVRPGGWLLDCFAGVATSLLSAGDLRPQRFIGAVGVEFNPFAVFAGRAKLAAPLLRGQTLRDLGLLVAQTRPSHLPPVPRSATVRNRRIFPRYRLDESRRLLGAIDERARAPYGNVLRLAVASALEPASFARKDGRALRLIPVDSARPSVRRLFLETVARMADDLDALAESPADRIPTILHRGDARNLPPSIQADSVSLALYSPPYLNGIDYSEVYKVEEWFLGFIKSNRELLELRRGTLRSHPSIRFPERPRAIPDGSAVQKLVDRISGFVSRFERRHHQKQYAWLVPAYFDDMYLALREQSRVLKSGGYAVCVVADSMLSRTIEVATAGGIHRRELWRLPIATDAILAALGREVGLETVGGIWARSLRPRNIRRGWSRETLIIMRKP